MTETTDVITLLREEFPPDLFTGRGRRWRARSEELLWVVDVDQMPHGRRLGLDIGLWPAVLGGDEPSRATDCPILVHVENLPLGESVERSNIIRTFDLDADVPDTERSSAIRQIGRALAQYISERSTLALVSEAYMRGDFASAFIRKDARGVLDRF